MFKNFRTQMIPLARSPIVSNIRTTAGRLNLQKPRWNQTTRKASSRICPARQQPSQKQHTPSPPGTLADTFAGPSLPSESFCSPQLAPSDSVKKGEYDPTLFLEAAYTSRLDNGESPSTPTAPIVASELYWQQHYWRPRPDLESVPALSIEVPHTSQLNGGESPSTSPAPSAASEPHWRARSDLEPVVTTQTA